MVRAHPQIFEAQRIPEKPITKNVWQERYEDINAFERHLARNGTVILKFSLNVSYEQQRALSRAIGNVGEKLEIL